MLAALKLKIFFAPLNKLIRQWELGSKMPQNTGQVTL